MDVWAMGVILFRALHGYFPFQAESCKELFELIKRGVYVCSPEVRACVSQCCLDFLAAMLQVDPAKRISTVQISNHPWVTGQLDQM